MDTACLLHTKPSSTMGLKYQCNWCNFGILRPQAIEWLTCRGYQAKQVIFVLVLMVILWTGMNNGMSFRLNFTHDFGFLNFHRDSGVNNKLYIMQHEILYPKYLGEKN